MRSWNGRLAEMKLSAMESAAGSNRTFAALKMTVVQSRCSMKLISPNTTGWWTASNQTAAGLCHTKHKRSDNFE